MLSELTRCPNTDPTQIYRYRDGLYAQDLLIVGIVWLDLFSWIARNPCSQSAVVQKFNFAERPTSVMLTLFVAMGLLERRGQVYNVTQIARDHLCSDSPWFLGPYYASLKDRPVCIDLMNVLGTGKPANWGSESGKGDWHKAMEHEAFAAQFTAAMDCRGVFLAQAVAKAIDLRECGRLLDIAGGSGVYACSLCAHFPGLNATVLEKPPVDRVAETAIAKRSFSDRVSVVAADMFLAPLPRDFDVHLFSNVLHDWDIPAVTHLVKKSYEALAPGGLLLIHDAHLDEDESGPLHVAEYSVMLMHSTEGRCYSARDMRQFLGEAGFIEMKILPTAAARSMIIARKPR